MIVLETASKLDRASIERLAVLPQHLDLVEQRDDLTIEYITCSIYRAVMPKPMNS